MNEIFINVEGKMVKYVLETSKTFEVTENETIILYTESELVEKIKKKDTPYFFIKYIRNSSETIQLASVTKCNQSIEHIENPTEKVQIFVTNKSPSNIRFIKNPTEKVQLD